MMVQASMKGSIAMDQIWERAARDLPLARCLSCRNERSPTASAGLILPLQLRGLHGVR